ncbi:MAG TPA: DHA2 family efflux MFS transporter permease subunit [Pseudolysinimonas sp.]|nr:DHA2 family efflux MFS transporter permease subunit [Pseudolysinimonas sp.]
MQSRARWIGLLFISIAVSLIIVDSTIVNVAIPSIVDELKIDSTAVQWVQTSYTLVFAALLIPFGTLADRVGRRRMLVIGVAVFTVASVLAGLSPDGPLLIAARVLQGIGGAMVLPATMSLINAGFRGRERAIAFAIWGSTIGGMAAVGPLLGGWLTTDFSWRWAFGVNVPFGIAVIVGVFFTVTESAADRKERFDVVGAALSVLAAGSLVFALIQGRSLGWWAPTDATAAWWAPPVSPIPLAFAFAVLAAIGFIAWERGRARRGAATMIPLDLFSIASFRNGNIVAMLISLGELGLLFVLPMWLQNVLRYSALDAGLILLALAIGSFLASGAVSGLSKRLSATGILRIGVGLELVALLVLGFTLRSDMGWLPLAALLFVYGLGLGLASAQITNVVLADVPVEQSGRASGTQSTSRQIGSALGVATLGTLLFSSISLHLADSLADLPDAQATGFVDAVTDSAGAVIPGLLDDPATADIGRLAADAFTGAAATASFGAAGFLAIALLASFFLGRTREDAAEASRPDAPTARTGSSSGR